jgi:hypothetical protein
MLSTHVNIGGKLPVVIRVDDSIWLRLHCLNHLIICQAQQLEQHHHNNLMTMKLVTSGKILKHQNMVFRDNSSPSRLETFLDLSP